MKVDWSSISIKNLAAMVCSALKDNNVEAVLVGGACVSIHSGNKYLSYDLDFVTHATMKEVTKAMEKIGFHKGGARHFVREDCPFYIEIVAPPVALGNEPVIKFEKLKTKSGLLVMLTSTDCVKDRLAAFYHWNDPQALEQALLVAEKQTVNTGEIKRWSIQEGHEDKYEIFRKALKSRMKKQ
jgi:hypothetical protein